MEKYGRVVEIKGDIAFVELETKNSETKCNYSSFCGRSRRADTTIEAIFDNKIQKGEA